MRYSSQNAKLLSTIAFLVLAFIPVEALASTNAILPLKVGKQTFKFQSALLRDPLLVDDTLTSGEALETSRRTIQRAKTVQRGTKVSASRLEEWMEEALSSVYALEQSKSKRLTALRKSVMTFSNAIIRSSANKRTKARARYHYRVQDFILQGTSPNSFGQLKDLVKNRSLNRVLKNKIAFLDHFYVLSEVAPSNSRRHQRSRNVIRSTMNNLGTLAKIAGNLAIAQSLAGIDANGDRIVSMQSRFLEPLKSANQIARYEADSIQKKVLRHSIWIHVRSGASLNKLPVSLGYVREHSKLLAAAIVERNALSAWKNGDKQRAVTLYKKIARDLGQTNTRVRIDRRLVDLNLAHYKTSGNSLPLQKELVTQLNFYEGNRLSTNHYNFIRGTFRSLSISKLKRALKASSEVSRDAINLGNLHLKLIPNDERLVLPLIGLNQAKVGNHPKASRIFEKLAVQTEQEKYWDLAIKSQMVIARWPKQAPWFKQLPSSDSESRARLARLFSKRRKMHAPSWPMLSHESLALIESGQISKALAVWKVGIKSSQSHPHANFAAAGLVRTYLKGQKWDDLESVSRFILAKKMNPTWNGKRISAKEVLATSLYEGGKQALTNKDFKKAVKKLFEYVGKFDHKHRDHGMYLLATSYYGIPEVPKSLEVLRAMVKQYPKSRYAKSAFIRGQKWSIAIAFEENIMYFHSEFLKRYPNDSKSAEVRLALIDIYEGRALYANAISELQKLAKQSPSGAAKFRLKAINLEEQFGDIRQAHTLCKKFNPNATKCKEIEVKLALKFGNAKQYNKYLKPESLSAGTESIRESKALMILSLAEGRQDKLMSSPDSLSLKDPEKTMRAHYADFQRVEKIYRSVCNIDASSYCASSFYELARLSEALVPIFEDYSIADTLSAKQVQSFNKVKGAIIARLKRLARDSDQRSYNAVQANYTLPNVTQAILWHNAKDWNFHPVSSEPGNGYLQWGVKK